jgi:small subunit ribosomal protein S2
MKRRKTQKEKHPMARVGIKILLESGVHFGHRTHRWNPHMKPYIFTERNGIHILDLQKTVKSLAAAQKAVSEVVANGGNVLFVGTKRQAQETIMDEANRCEMPYVNQRWLGGMITNWTTMRERINELDRLERMRDRGDFALITKKEGLMITRKIDKLETRFGGIRNLHKVPDMLFIVDVRREFTALKEANTLGIPIVGLVDTNCDPRDVDHVIPSNDDAIRAIKVMVKSIADAVIEGKATRKEDESESKATAAAAASAMAQMDSKAEELSDEDLLGASTLAKMEADKVEVAAEEATDEVTPEATPEATPEVTPEAPTDTTIKE